MEFEKLQKIIAEVMNVSEEEIRPETTFVDDLGADSLDVFQIIMGIEEGRVVADVAVLLFVATFGQKGKRTTVSE